jgi:Fe-S-cluster-containing dehydrogenase component
VQLGFVIDHTRCIGCHACTVACKAENTVPVGSFRTWVKYTEKGAFPEVKRSFAVLRCNQCTAAPCVTICPVGALEKRPDGIVDVDPARCIGCKACMHGCPYDALYLNDASGTAEKCHFCAHRTEIGLAPACAVVCPTEAIIPGDFHDPESAVSRLRREHALSARKTEAGTGPNVLYREVDDAGIDPLLTTAAGSYLWSNRKPGPTLDAERFQAAQDDAETRARTTYSVDRTPHWGGKITGYLFGKSLAAGIFLVLAALSLPGFGISLTPATRLGFVACALFFLAVTLLLLVADLKRPERFLFLFIHPNWSSWLTRGSFLLAAYGLALAGAGVAAVAGNGPWTGILLGTGSVLAVLTAAYTGWLFGQARGRVLWMRRGLWLHLAVQAAAAGAAFALVAAPWLGLPGPAVVAVRWILAGALAGHLAFLVTEGAAAPPARRREYARAERLVSRGPYAFRRYALGLGIGTLLPLAGLLVPGADWAWGSAAFAALIGLLVEEDTMVRAGQAPSIS